MLPHKAHSFRLGTCDRPDCRALHFELLDADGRVFAVMTIAAVKVARLTDRMKDIAYQIIATKGLADDADHGP